MYFAVGWPKYYGAKMEEQPGQPRVFKFNRDRSILAVLTEDRLTLWYCRPFVVIVSYCRSTQSLCEIGSNEDFAWKFDSSSIVIKTSNGRLIFFELQLSKGDSGQLFVLKNQRNVGNSNYKIMYGVPAIHLAQTVVVSIVGGVSSLSVKRSEIFVASKLGVLHRLQWNGLLNSELSLPVSSIPFSLDLETPIESAQYLKASESIIRDMQYSPLLGGFAIVLENGRGGFLSASAATFEPQDVLAIWARDLTRATCVKVNHKFRVLGYGCTHGGVLVYSFDEVTGALLFSHKIELQTKHMPNSHNLVEAVDNLCFSPDGHVLAVSWVGGGLALWSVFGSLLFCTLDTTFHGFEDDVFLRKPWHMSAMEWSVEGYNLLLAIEKPSSDGWIGTGEIVHVPFVKSLLSSNPCVANHHHLALQGEMCLYLSTADVVSDTRTRLHDAFGIEGAGFDGQDGTSASSSTKHWQIIQYPHIYLEKNWPVRCVAVDESGMCLAIAGRMGVAHYSLLNRRWKLFGNESQEQSIYCRGGLLWWNDFLVVACYNIQSGSDEIRFYPRSSNLDNTFATEVTLRSSPFLINVLDNILLVYCSDCKLTFYSLDKVESTGSIQVSRLQDVSLVSHVPHPLSVIEITLSMACLEEGSAQSGLSDVESLILNIGGKLLMLQRLHEKERSKKMQFSAPVVLASCVEGIWSSLKTSATDKQHLVEALWLNCGVNGMKVWLPLFPGDDEKPPNFLSKRIMLPIPMSLCPLVVLSEEALVVGAASEPMHIDLSANQTDFPISAEEPFPLYILERPAQVYLHHLLRQLLRRNLGIHALRIARSCSELLYFPHVLELMLHEILEEEATASEPLPDAMLPRIVAFIQEFPEYLQTVVHCARKTEVALWSYLFAAVGNPRDLFQKCLDDGFLETAASYLIILQNLEKPEVSKQLATILLEATLKSDKYEIARDLVRFLGSITVSDLDSPPVSPLIKTPVMSSALPSMVDDEFDLTPLPQGIHSHSQSSGSVLMMASRPPLTRISSSDKLQSMRTHALDKATVRGRHTSEEKSSTSMAPVTPKKSDSQKQTESLEGSHRIMFRYSQGDSPEGFFLDTILNRHARKLLGSNRLKDLGRFSAFLEFNLRDWLQKERDRAAIVNDFVEAFLAIHRQFDWPFPSRSVTSPTNTGTVSSMRPSLLSANHLNWKTNEDIYDPNDDEQSAGRSDVELKGKQMEHSEASSVSFSMDDDPEGLEDSMWSYDTNIKDLDDFVGQLSGTKQAEREIRFLLQAMMDSCCFDWSLLLALALRDAPLVHEVIENAILVGMDELALENFIRLRDGVKMLENWAQHECQGYSTFFGLFTPQWQSLSEAIRTVATRLAENQVANRKRETEQSNIVDEGMDSAKDKEDTREHEEGQGDQYECVVS